MPSNAARIRRVVLFPFWLFGWIVNAIGEAAFAGMDAQARRRRGR